MSELLVKPEVDTIKISKLMEGTYQYYFCCFYKGEEILYGQNIFGIGRLKKFVASQRKSNVAIIITKEVEGLLKLHDKSFSRKELERMTINELQPILKAKDLVMRQKRKADIIQCILDNKKSWASYWGFPYMYTVRCFDCGKKLVSPDDAIELCTRYILKNTENEKKIEKTEIRDFFCLQCATVWQTHVDNKMTEFQKPDFPVGTFSFELKGRGT
jgi:hypothetical protein